MQARQKGFTLIELIIVIVVLGILAVTAAPQFLNFSGDAREATLKGLKTSMVGASEIVYGKALIAGLEAKSSVDEAGATYLTTSQPSIEVVFGYPAATAGGITAALNIEAGDWAVAYTAPGAGTIGTSSATVRFAPIDVVQSAAVDVADHTTIDKCYIQYVDVTTAGDRPAITFADPMNC
jgi:MSHA pilin protein MshA